MRISDWSSDVCSSDLRFGPGRSGGVLAAVQRAAFGGAHHSKSEISFLPATPAMASRLPREHKAGASPALRRAREHQPPPSKLRRGGHPTTGWRSEEHTSELQSLMRNSYAVFCLKKKYHHCMPGINVY